MLAKRIFLLGVALLCLTACDGLATVNTAATLEAENSLYGTEIAMLQVSSQDELISAQSTITIDQTRVAVVNAINHQLLATLVREITPTPPLQLASDALRLDGTQVAQFAGQRLFVKTGVSSQVNPSDGCVINPSLRFPKNTQAIYATMRVQNLGPGIELSADWYYVDQLVLSESWVVDRNYGEICIWFNITPEKAPLTPGFWAVRLLADRVPLEDAMTFVIETE